MKKLLKKSVVILLALMLLASLLIPVLAYGETNSVGLGYDTQTIYINNTPYTATLYLAGNVTDGGYSVFSTAAKCTRYHYTVTVVFSTQGTGQETYSGGAKTYRGDDRLGVTGMTDSNRVTYRGSDTATSIKHIAATGRITTINQDGTTQSYTFSAAAGS